MKMNIHKSAPLGDLVAAAFDEAAHRSADPREVLRLATQDVMHVLRRAQRTDDEILADRWAQIVKDEDL